MRQFLKQNFHNTPDFELKVLQRGTIWIEKYTTR